MVILGNLQSLVQGKIAKKHRLSTLSPGELPMEMTDLELCSAVSLKFLENIGVDLIYQQGNWPGMGKPLGSQAGTQVWGKCFSSAPFIRCPRADLSPVYRGGRIFSIVAVAVGVTIRQSSDQVWV